VGGGVGGSHFGRFVWGRVVVVMTVNGGDHGDGGVVFV
jgi:hypothetical protein